MDLFKQFLEKAQGYKTYTAALGLLGLALYQFSLSQYDIAFQSFLGALAAFGLRSAIANNSVESTQEEKKG